MIRNILCQVLVHAHWHRMSSFPVQILGWLCHCMASLNKLLNSILPSIVQDDFLLLHQTSLLTKNHLAFVSLSLSELNWFRAWYLPRRKLCAKLFTVHLISHVLVLSVVIIWSMWISSDERLFLNVCLDLYNFFGWKAKFLAHKDYLFGWAIHISKGISCDLLCS